MEPPPPSYREATERQDWLRLVAPYISLRDHASLCLVSRRFYRHFAPRLWNDPVAVLRVVRPHADCDEGTLPLRAYHDFILRRVDETRPATRRLVRSLDLRGFGRDESEFSLDTNTRTLGQTLERLSSKFPRLRCILIDGHPEVNPNYLLRNHLGPGLEPPLLLSMPGCQAGTLEAAFFASPYFRNLVYLDISDVPEAMATKALRDSIRPELLPRLRILKAQGQSMGDAEALSLLSAFKQRIWSLDLSRNRLTDKSLRNLRSTFPSVSFRDLSRSRTHRFAVEGVLIDHPHSNPGDPDKTLLVVESNHSASFSHPDRHLVDTPDYPGTQDPLAASRSNGRTAVWDDSPSAVKQALAADGATVEDGCPSLDSVFELDLCQANRGTTHLYLNHNNISAPGITSLITSSPGHFERFECDSMSFPVPEGLFPPWMPPNTKLSGLLGAAHLFRPVFSSNLQVLRIHHSLVTNLLSIRTDHLSEPLPTMVESWMAETYLLPRADLAYPQTFIPDMNPRLRSLILTHIPRYSTGPLIHKLTTFLHLLSLQERAIRSSLPPTRHGPQTLPGLRSLTLEFAPDPIHELHELQAADENATFSFFDDESSPSSRTPAHHPLPPKQTPNQPPPSPSPRDTAHDIYTPSTLAPSGRPITIFTGSSSPATIPPTAIAEYTRLCRTPSLQARIEPASPCHVAAGVPPGAYVFGEAWDAVLMGAGMARPGVRELAGMRDVFGAVRGYRAKTRGKAGWWGGEVRVLRG
ncbi:hypothetical protein QBC39DRAFT_255956 [Podospora conica]|nr:hypothetical protein QBC39DRAFT_255956 [Schizothecium conicum]